jgi:hypothetical protein
MRAQMQEKKSETGVPVEHVQRLQREEERMRTEREEIEAVE